MYYDDGYGELSKIYDRNKYTLLWICEKILDVSVRLGVCYIADYVIVKELLFL
jgi:hypothetical protein